MVNIYTVFNRFVILTWYLFQLESENIMIVCLCNDIRNNDVHHVFFVAEKESKFGENEMLVVHQTKWANNYITFWAYRVYTVGFFFFPKLLLCSYYFGMKTEVHMILFFHLSWFWRIRFFFFFNIEIKEIKQINFHKSTWNYVIDLWLQY